MKELERAYLAGLFDGEGCANASFRSKKVKKRYYWPSVQFVISGQKEHMQLIKEMIGFGGVYKGAKGETWDYRITQPKQILLMIEALLPNIRLKNKELKKLKEASRFILKHEPRTRWTEQELIFFRKNHVLPLQKESRSGKPRGRPPHTPFMKQSRDAVDRSMKEK